MDAKSSIWKDTKGSLPENPLFRDRENNTQRFSSTQTKIGLTVGTSFNKLVLTGENQQQKQSVVCSSGQRPLHGRKAMTGWFLT